MIFQQPTGQDPLSIIFQLIFYVFLFVSIFYGQKIQFWQYSRQLEGALQKIKGMKDEVKNLTKTKIIELRKTVLKTRVKKEESNISTKELDSFLDEFMQFVMIQPVSLDPSGIIQKLDHLVNVRESRWEDTIKMLVPGISSVDSSNLENLLESAMAVDSIYRVVRHFYIQGKKTNSLIFVMQMAMQIKIILQMTEAYAKAAKAFYNGHPIGDGLGPQVAATFVRDVNPKGVKARDICKETIVQEVEFKGRKVYVIRAKGPGGTVGKPGEAIKIQIEELGDKVNRIIMVDAAMKLEGEKTGSVIEGVGAAIGGIGVEKYKIEDSTVDREIPVDAIICKQNLLDAITTMKKSISNSVRQIVTRIKIAIETRTKEGDCVILAGIGNTIGIGI
ncbi:MAG: DUF1512 family protein [Promethearchaeota archaeon]